MNTSLSFDQAADFYDKTRPSIETTTEAGIQALFESAGKGSRILEVGTGTGRISIPLLERGADLIGCDISVKMLARQQEKFPAARLAQSDAVSLPFLSGHFDAVLGVHVMHLIGPWKEALHEFKRVLRLGGVFLNASTHETVGTSARSEMHTHWREWLRERGVDTRHPGAQTAEEVRAELESMGAHWKTVDVVHFPTTYTLRRELDRYEKRTSSVTWSIPEAIYLESLIDLRGWVSQQFGDIDQEIQETSRFFFDVVHFDAV
ncbi:MAG: class I SAM-dependent methyltransferase [Anaerolineales bacterium]